MRRIVTAALAACLSVTMAGCGADETVVSVSEKGEVATTGTHVDGTEPGAVTVPLGEKLVVDLGEWNNSIGDGWFLVTPPDPAVLTDEGNEHDPECDQPGCGGKLSWHFATASAGATELTLRYCYRSRPAACEPMPDRGPADPVTIKVTVTG